MCIDVFVDAGSGGLELPQDLVFDSSGNLYVTTDLTHEVLRYLEQLPSGSLGDPVFKINSLTRQRSGTRRSDVLLHVCTHTQYTTAQAINMMRHIGVQELPDPMLISLARQEFSVDGR